jgi:uncharacterized OsmC-like protein
MRMEIERLIQRVRSRTLPGIPGRCLNTARNHHFVIDEPPYGGGPGEELTPAEAFLSGISGCAVLLLEKFAREESLPLRSVEAEIEGIRTKENPADFVQVNLRLELKGVTPLHAERLVERFKGR